MCDAKQNKHREALALRYEQAFALCACVPLLSNARSTISYYDILNHHHPHAPIAAAAAISHPTASRNQASGSRRRRRPCARSFCLQMEFPSHTTLSRASQSACNHRAKGGGGTTADARGLKTQKCRNTAPRSVTVKTPRWKLQPHDRREYSDSSIHPSAHQSLG